MSREEGWSAGVTTAERTLRMRSEPIADMFKVTPVRADLTPQVHAIHGELAHGATSLKSVALLAHILPTGGLFIATVGASQTN